MLYSDMDEIYRTMDQEKIPWNIEEPPQVLVELVESGRVAPCRALDLGCGAGNYAVYLAGRGFDVMGVDISPTAIGMAAENARKRGAACSFFAADVLGDLHEVDGIFDLAYDWELLHHLYPEQREKYVVNVRDKLKPGGSYLSLCFSEQDPQFGGQGKYRKTPLGTTLYFSSEEELRKLFERHFEIQELRTIKVRGKYAPHLAVCAFMTRR
ncbi:MAG: methyltransferase type 12 [Nitrospirae bacterium GWC2_57_13]|nr:MAG: methyltransferase type 12 [Nitrospirae bacterium GWC2_57_13]OGW46908.1 MAG: methyltransferase type 12 [Nitrospirae bacterium GWD2_57_8]HAS55475.1 class I SAM-dependent methyltransferase [Nitrospiraceae bacterium]